MPCGTDDEVWSQSNEDLGQIVKDSLQTAGIPVTAPVREVLVRRIPHAYPIYDQGFEKHFEVTDQYVGQIDRLLTFGRQGLFVHDNTHHALYMAYAAADCVDPQGQFDKDKWRTYRQGFENHVVED